jgi:hypothetical protein
MIFLVMDIAGITYGPLLGLFAFGILTKKLPKDKFVPFICLLSAGICMFLYVSSKHKAAWLSGYSFGQELLIINGTLTFLGLWLISKSNKKLTS